MTNKTELNAVVKTLKDLYTKEAELKEAISNQEAIIKDYMELNKLTKLNLTNGSVSFMEVLTKSLNTKAFRAQFESLYQQFTVERISKRFKIA